jgi:type III pantothenate kinase
MNLIADIGNTATKVALYDKGEKVTVSRIHDLNCLEIDRITSANKVEKAIVSSVKILPPFVKDALFRKISFVHVLSHNSKLPFGVEYSTPETLGTDRLAAVAGAYNLFPGKNVLVIDAGTAITFDFLIDNMFKGGNISPGITMRFKALNFFTNQLPLITPAENYTSPGLNTTDAITAGVLTGVIYEINEYIRTFEEKQSGCEVIITGGDAGFLKENIHHPVNYLPDVVIEGLNFILEYNAQ